MLTKLMCMSDCPFDPLYGGRSVLGRIKNKQKKAGWKTCRFSTQLFISGIQP